MPHDTDLSLSQRPLVCSLQVMLLQPGAWLGAFLQAAAGELAAPPSAASTEVLHALLLQGGFCNTLLHLQHLERLQDHDFVALLHNHVRHQL